MTQEFPYQNDNYGYNIYPGLNDFQERKEDNDQICIPQEKVITDVKLAHGYVPFQFYCSAFMPMEALRHGTAFPELVDPYVKGEHLMEEC